MAWRKGDGHGRLPSTPLLGDLRARPLWPLVCKQRSRWGGSVPRGGPLEASPPDWGALDPWLHLPGLADLNQPCRAGQGAETLSTGPHCTPRAPPTLLRAGVGVHVLHSRSRSGPSFNPRGIREQTVGPGPPGPPGDQRADGYPAQDPQGADGCPPGPPGSRRPPPRTPGEIREQRPPPRTPGEQTATPRTLGEQTAAPQDPRGDQRAEAAPQDSGRADSHPQDPGRADGHPQDPWGADGHPQDPGRADSHPQDPGEQTATPRTLGEQTAAPQDPRGDQRADGRPPGPRARQPSCCCTQSAQVVSVAFKFQR
nr:basic salivary proline-rich protein 4-like [Ovis aries]